MAIKPCNNPIFIESIDTGSYSLGIFWTTRLKELIKGNIVKENIIPKVIHIKPVIIIRINAFLLINSINNHSPQNIRFII